MSRRKQQAMERVIEALGNGDEWHYVLDLLRATGLSSGRLYPALDQLLAEGRIMARWEDGQWPRRRLYLLAADR